MYLQRKIALNPIALQHCSKYCEIWNKAKTQCPWRALLLTAIIQCSYTSEANFLLLISPQFILSGQDHSSQSDFHSVHQFSVSRKTPLGPWCAVFTLGVSFVATQTLPDKRPSISALEAKGSAPEGRSGHTHWANLTAAWPGSWRTAAGMRSPWTQLRRSVSILVSLQAKGGHDPTQWVSRWPVMKQSSPERSRRDSPAWMFQLPLDE